MSTINPNFVPQSFVNQQTGELKVDKTLAETVQAGVQARLDQLPDIGDAAFKAAIADLTPDQLDTPAEMNAALDKYQAAAQKLSDALSSTTFAGDISKFLARAMIEQAGASREQALNDRQAARQAAQAEMTAQADKMQDAASQMMAGAVTSLVMTSISGAVSMLGALKSAKSQAGEIKNMAKASVGSVETRKAMDSLDAADAAKSSVAGKTNADVGGPPKIGANRAPAAPAAGQGWLNGTVPTAVQTPQTPVGAAKAGTQADSAEAIAKQNRSAEYQALDGKKTAFENDFKMAEKRSGLAQVKAQSFEAAGGMLRGVGSSSDSMAQASAKSTEAESSRDAAQAEYLKQVADGHQQVLDSMKDMMQQIISFIKEMQDAEVDAMRAITRA